ncbi:MAG TPA: HAD-IIB family hydrolase [Chthoniobacterales bacterium]|jgi:HAD superfamily hydrolase (TIGR01484 family)|nr:HAD-IIB family hydrolase [Chthoniobacterales bacterium]
MKIQLLSIDFDGTMVSRVSEPVLDRECMELIRELQSAGAIWAINTGRSVDLLESGLADFEFPIRPDFILTSERDVFRPGTNGTKWEPFGDWNQQCARAHAELFSSTESVLAEVADFVTQKTKAQLIYHSEGLEGLRADSDEEMERIVDFIERARGNDTKFNYQRNMVYLRFCHADYHKGAVLAELARLINIPRKNIFAAGDHHNDISMLNGDVAGMPACPANAIAEVKAAVRGAGGYIAGRQHGAGVHEALQFFLD